MTSMTTTTATAAASMTRAMSTGSAMPAMPMTRPTGLRSAVSVLVTRLATARRPIRWRLEDDWLLLSRPVNRVVPRGRLSDLLRRNATLDGLVKFAGLPGRRTEIRAEIPLDLELDLDQQIEAVARGLGRASAALRETAHAPTPAQASPPAGTQAGTGVDLPALCAELGMAFTERDDGALSVELPGVAGLCGHARLEPASRTGGGFRAWLALGPCGELGPESREALGVLLLSASATVRLARAVVRPGDEGEMAGVEVQWPTVANARALEHALGALAAGGRYFGREVNALCDPSVARAYLDTKALGG